MEKTDFLPLAPFTSRIQSLIRRNEQAPENLITDIVKNCGLLDEKNFQQVVHLFMSVCFFIDELKINTLGQRGSTKVSNSIHSLIAARLAEHWYEKIGKSDLEWLDRRREWSDTKWGWFVPKLTILYAGINHLKRVKLMSDIIRVASWKRPVDENKVRELMNGIHDLRRYGVKSSIFKDSNVPILMHHWVIWDPHDIPAHRSFGEFVAFGGMMHALRKDIHMGSHVEEYGNASSSTVVEVPKELEMIFGIDTEGELRLLFGNCTYPLRRFFEREGMSERYEVMRSIFALRLFDLTVPLIIVQNLPRLPFPKSGVGGLMERVIRPADYPDIVDLFIPRVRILNDQYQPIVSGLVQEIDEGTTETAHRAKRREHTVVAHIRKLPQGHKPSQKAIELAEEYGIILRDNETFIQTHTRGSGNPVQLYRLKKNR